MSSQGASRWTDGPMQARVASRYAAERRFRLFGWQPWYLVAFLLSCSSPGVKGLAASPDEAKLTINFRNRMLIDPPAARSQCCHGCKQRGSRRAIRALPSRIRQRGEYLLVAPPFAP